MNDAGETVIPADALVDIFSSLSDSLSDEPLMSGEEVAMFEALLKNNPGLEVTPQIILNFIEEKTKTYSPRSQRKQRATPLAAPSSWSIKRPLPPRRKSDAGSRSDSDVCSLLYHVLIFVSDV